MKQTYYGILFMCPSSKNVLEANRSDGEQFADRGNQYKPGIFYHNKFQKKATEESERSIEKSEKFSGPILVEILPFTSFYPAEDYH
ncbi:peptide-methionine (S)-S-oxide reductase [Leptospira borgpetersenii]|nr:peptide-methionine (S)-S-oxide reductase [Leptospira borgpetersenii]UOY18035.1 peptide-methionine (S)-S-oxide reductase [Leptospira borgpetersenii]UOZ24660.1 peptide-methionine (S)-S-oxide reductase [Leptospira borgpetersenii]UPO14811.1 peptide-methionine (S)-S-oxide reductase [Leptospira borgpetersenii]UYM84301.1 peptide-methionine (S)-S-oxide reductase [Leptospira borgpetersenii]UZN10281.1 peptide-methionine (S)-S-oxide reductase [Leptospira borgpetersenii]